MYLAVVFPCCSRMVSFPPEGHCLPGRGKRGPRRSKGFAFIGCRRVESTKIPKKRSCSDGICFVDRTMDVCSPNFRLIPTRDPLLPQHPTRKILEQIGSTRDGSPGDYSSVGGHRRPWELRPVIHTNFKSFVEEGRKDASQEGGPQHPASFLSRLNEDGLRHSMDGAIEMRSEQSVFTLKPVFVRH